MVDRFYVPAHFSMLPNHLTAVKVADLFAEIIYRLYGMPRYVSLLKSFSKFESMHFEKKMDQINVQHN